MPISRLYLGLIGSRRQINNSPAATITMKAIAFVHNLAVSVLDHGLLSGAIVFAACLFFVPVAQGATVRDDFATQSFGNNDGTNNWSADWIEVDGDGLGPRNGNVRIRRNRLELDDRPDTGGEPSLEREVNLLGATAAIFSFAWRTGNIDNPDSFVVEVSSDGGGAWTTLENFTGLNGRNSGSRSFDILAFASSNTRIRFRVNSGYGDRGERFQIDFVEIDFTGLNPSLLLLKSVNTIADPINGLSNPKAIPGATVRYLIMTTNTGLGTVDADTVLITDTIPANVALRVIDFDGANSGPIAFIDGTPSSALSYNFISLGAGADDVEFSNDGGATYTYTPTPDANGTDLNVSNIRINPKGTFAASLGGGDPSFQLFFKVVVQ